MHRNARLFQEPPLQSRTAFQRSDYDQIEVDFNTSLQQPSSRSASSNHEQSFGAVVDDRNDRAASPMRLTTKRNNSDGCLSQVYESSFWDWKWEIMSMVSSLGLLGGVCMTLAQYHHGQQPEWPFNININSLVSILTTVLIAQLGFILAELISQLKWSWFRNPHPLQDLEHYDAASRGLLGALFFLCRFIGHRQAYLAVGASFIVLISAAIGPFTQQSIKPYACHQPLHNVSASIAAARYVGFEPIVGRWHRNSQYAYPNMEMMTAVLEGMVGSVNNSKTVPFHCPTGDCDFSPHSSLGYCSSCVDISHDVQEQPNLRHTYPAALEWTYTIPGKVCQLRSQNNTGLRSSFTSMEEEEVYYPSPTQLIICYEGEDRANGALTFTIISICSSDLIHGVYDALNSTAEYVDDDRPRCPEHPEHLSDLGNSSLVAMSCTLGLCARDYTSRVRNGVLSETTSSLTSHIIDTSGDQFKLLRLPCVVNSDKYDLSNISEASGNHGVLSATVYLQGQNLVVPNACVFRIDHSVPSAISKFLQSGLFHPHDAQTSGMGACSWDMHSNSSVCNPWYLEPFVRGARTNAEIISSIMDNITLAITNRMRAASSASDPRDNLAPGTVTQTTVCLRVDWPWLLMPAALVLITVALLVVVLYRARRAHLVDGQPIWKSSAIAALFHGIHARSHCSGCTNGNTACAPTSTNSLQRPTNSLQRPKNTTYGESYKGLMTLGQMQAMAEKLVVTLETGTIELGGFSVIREDEKDDHSMLLERSTIGEWTGSLLNEQMLLAGQLSNSNSALGQFPTYLQIDLGVGLAPSICSSLERFTLSDLEASHDRET